MKRRIKRLICKVSPLITETEIDYLLNLGFTQIHASNTIPVEKGGLSGKSIIPHTLRILSYIKEYHPSTIFIAGGGITTTKDVIMYKDAGADYISIGTVCFNIFNLARLLRYENNNTRNN